MRNDELYSRILRHRKSKQDRDEIPFINWDNKTSKSLKLYNQIRRKIKDKISLREALIQFIISDITAFEVYFKDSFHSSFEFCESEVEFLTKCQKLVDRKFEFLDLIAIQYKEIELNEIVLEYQNFQNLSMIDKVFSVIMKENFLDSFNDREFKIEGEHDNEPYKLRKNWFPKLEKYLKLRHDLTHDYHPKLRLRRDEIFELHYNLVDFIIAVDLVFEEEMLGRRSGGGAGNVVTSTTLQVGD